MHNEELHIKDFTVKLCDFLILNKELDAKLLIVNDNSSDKTLNEIKIAFQEVKKKSTNEFFSVVTSTLNKGYGNAIKFGINSIKFENWDYCIIMDSDGTNPIEDIAKFCKQINLGFRYVKANRYFFHKNTSGYQQNLKRGFLSKLAHYIVNFLVNSNCLDPTNGFRAFGKELSDIVTNNSGGFSSIVEEWIKVEELGIEIGNINSNLGSRTKDQRITSFRYDAKTIISYLKPILSYFWRKNVKLFM